MSFLWYGSVFPLRMRAAAFVFIALALIAFGFTGYSWAGWQPASCMPAHCFCEAARVGPVAQPVNAWSNLAYVVVGLLVPGTAPGAATQAGLFNRRRVYSWIYGSALVVIGLGSWFYHASLTFAGQWLDVMGMYLLGTFLWLYAAARLWSFEGRPFALTYAALNSALGVILIVAPELRRLIFGGLLAGAIALEAWVHRAQRPAIQSRYFIAALTCLTVAYGIWTLDNLRVMCWPQSWFQGHAIWHGLTAAAAWMLSVYYRSERSGGVEFHQQAPSNSARGIRDDRPGRPGAL